MSAQSPVRPRLVLGRALLCVVVLLSFVAVSMPSARADYSELPAFPGAEGFGYAAAGGRGGEVYHVSSTEPTGPGTLHHGLTTTGSVPRTIVFEVSGDLEIPQIIVEDASNITIAGQTAPGGGVTVRGGEIRFVDSHDIVIRYLRFRLGADPERQGDTMYFEDCQRVIIDHSSFSWGTDEVLSIKSKDYDNPRSREISVQWSIMSEGLLTHSMGGLVEMNTISMHHNLYAHNNDRNPKTKGQMDFVNNIVYNWGSYPYVAGGESGTKGYGNVVGNYFIAGANSASPEYAVVRGNENYSLFLQDNRIDSDRDGILDGVDTGADMMEEERPSRLVPERFEYPPVHTQAPEEAYELVLDHAGASLVRDAVDARIIRDVRDQTGVIIGDESDVGGFPEVDGGTAPVDADRDGMADEWERRNGLDPTDPEDRNGDADGNGYTNLEEYLHELAAPGFPVDYPQSPPQWTGEPFEPPVQPEPERGPLPVLDGDVLRNVLVHDDTTNGAVNATHWSVEQDLQLGDVVAGDRTYTFQVVPEELRGLEWIRSAVESRGATSEDLVSFSLTADADVYVAHDTRISEKPQWLAAGYEETGLSIEDDQPVTWEIFKQSYSAGSEVVMGPNNGGSRMNYFVLVEPTAAQTPPPAAAPSGLSASSAAGEVALTWDEAEGADSYLVYRWSMLDPQWRAMGSASTAEFTDGDASFGVEYRYRVTALSAGGESGHSDPVTTLSYDPSEPAAPTPEALEAEPNSYSVELSWPAVETALGYTVYRSAGEADDYAALGSVSGPAFVDEDVDPEQSYHYAVSATSAGGESERSAPVAVTTGPELEPAGTPTDLVSDRATATAFSLVWEQAEHAETYHVYRKADGEGDYQLLATSAAPEYLDTDLDSSSTGYSYAVTAVNELGESDRSSEVRIPMPLAEPVEDLFAGLTGDTFVGLIWTSHGGAAEYVVYRSSDGEAPRQVGTAKVDTFYDRTVEPDTEYTYVVRTANATGESEPSASITVVTGPHQWDPETTYRAGDRVTYAGAVFEAQWWSEGEQPGDPTGAWAEVGDEVQHGDHDVRRWSASWIYTGGELVVHEGQLYRAQWWSRNQEPGEAGGAWSVLPTG